MSDAVGHVLAAIDLAADAAMLLGEADWAARFDAVAVTADGWAALERLGVWEAVNAACGCLIDRYEEEWVAASELDRLLAALRSARAGMGPQDGVEAAGLVDAMAGLAERARMRGVAVIFSM